MTWLFEGRVVEQLPEDCVGYVYCITNTVTGRMYIGKKLSKFSKTTYKTVKLKNGTKKRKKIKTKIDSDWQNIGAAAKNSKRMLLPWVPTNSSVKYSTTAPARQSAHISKQENNSTGVY